MAWKYFSVSTATWGGKVEVPAFDFTGGVALNAGSSGTASFKIADPWVAEAVTRDTIAPWERVLVAEWNDSAVYAGFITGIDEDPDAGTVTVQHADIWEIWKHRYMLNVRGNGSQSAPPIEYRNVTLATLANLAIAKGMAGSPAEKYALPVITNAQVAGSDARTYEGFKFVSVADALDELMSTAGGPDVTFDAQWVGYPNQLRWVASAGAITNGLWEWDATASEKEVFGLKLKTDAARVANKVIGTGEGSERSLLVRDDASFTAPMPALERVESFQGVSNGAQLQSRVTADLNASNDPVQQISFKIPVTGTVRVSELRVGGTARLKTAGLLFLSDGWRDWRLIQFDFDRDWVTLQFQPIGG